MEPQGRSTTYCVPSAPVLSDCQVRRKSLRYHGAVWSPFSDPLAACCRQGQDSVFPQKSPSRTTTRTRKPVRAGAKEKTS